MTTGSRQSAPRVTSNWGESLVRSVLYPFASFAAPAFILLLIVLFISRAFSDDLSHGLRSFSAALLPLMAVTYLTMSRKTELSRQASKAPSWFTFAVMFAVGVALMPILSVSSSLPFAELVLSGCFSVLVAGSVLIGDRDKAMSYYFGLILGVLSFVVLAGFPVL
jgi:hypothetical protein